MEEEVVVQTTYTTRTYDKSEEEASAPPFNLVDEEEL